ncbi:MAG: cupin domain-containing protein [Desulfomonilaceae bacterium]|nr:cupin domain-containing protein [Desulfomonilaceae bacterium]
MEIRTWNAVEEQKIGESISRKVFWGENIMVTKWEIRPNTVLPIHDHVAEQITMVQRGTLTLKFPDDKDVLLHEGDMLVIPPSVRHGVEIGPEGASVIDLFSPIREDFISRSETYLPSSGSPETESGRNEEKYKKFQSYLTAGGIKIPLEQLLEVPLDILARYVYERECITMGQLREIMGLDKTQAKALLREWKHGDDHSQSSLQKAMQRRVILPWEGPGSEDK